ncbi:spore germination protein [Paenibacillus eucommiae]|uniref:Spore germination protein KA n=1 Tax=Paenibacillus eucommiae TaxID=1355755 RepID=A0ABS4IQY1_9BACL|nr:spore germination protein [Paenibacillus eucommiae]MBP1989972.1 spore germination protein KA [Paenibacillus eucommiae]
MSHDPSNLDNLLSIHLEQNKTRLQQLFSDCTDIVYLDCDLGQTVPGLFVYFNGLTDEERLDEIRQSVSTVDHRIEQEVSQEASQEVYFEDLIYRKINHLQFKELPTFNDIADQLTMGNPVLVVDGMDTGYAFSLACWRKRAVEDPVAESVVRGPREGFSESITDNMAMLRRRIRNPDLKMKGLELGLYTKTCVTIAYVEGLAAPELIAEVEKRLAVIEVDGVLESGNIEEYIEDQPFSPFPQIMATERPDTVTASLLEGRVAILTDGTPFCLVAPISLFSLLQSPEDFYQRYMISTAIRWLRYTFFLIALIAPSAYVAVLTYHQEMIPSSLLFSIVKSREEIPFPALVEAFIMETMFEALREAGVRLPKQVGAAVSIVGALVIGQAATSAGLVSSPMVMVVAITGIASFLIPHYTIGISIRLLRFPIMLLAGILGLLGLLIGLIAIVIHLCSLRSFGTPYLSPLAPMMSEEWKDVLVRAPAWTPTKRPRLTRAGGGSRSSRTMKPVQPLKEQGE